MSMINKVIGATAAAAALALALPSVASADDAGWRTGPLQFWAEGNDQCAVTFHLQNATNGVYYIDYVVDDENPAALVGQPGVWGTAGTVVNATYDGVATSRVVGRRGVASQAEAPLFQAGGAPYVTNREPVLASQTINLRDLAGLPNTTSDTHTIAYQVVLGPNGRDKGWDPVAKTFARPTATVSGCVAETGTTLAGPTTAAPGTEALYTATVAPEGATGTVQFLVDGTPAGAPVVVTNGQATLAHTFAAEGAHTVTAEFTGAAGFANSTSNEVAVTVTAENTGGGCGSLDGLFTGSAGSSC